ncbi:hypothetical protein A374_04769 [Fictibacillus macauensis ZFHKF-1]|uniref:Uracil-DNA glycosylase-like domain-containing protein n=1 Tax=Fictibacillus macauensis ZFHKF-1 TaxID=1196324 RepID=I8UJ47_9BACL|nr:uracil-DNA glycosylase family protein [Fictibacillus macauensis]EIT86858.1 hypothetical protein A374_04769 [Fictibacillus macauensis ZFHKF-1]
MEYPIEALFQEAQERFSVHDVIREGVSLVFLLESPHVDELTFNAPLAGSSGRSVTKILTDQAETLPFGRLLAQEKDHDLYRRIGIMNVCSFPLQQAAIQDVQFTSSHASFFTIANKVRTANERTHYKNEEWNTFQHVMQRHFQQRLKRLQKQPLILVPCGKFAQKHLLLSGITSEQWRIIWDVPHPSYNAWSKDRYAPNIQKVKEAFTSLKT